MDSNLRISIHFLNALFHGRRGHGEPEWPPSSLRLFQSLVAAAARLGAGSVSPDSKAALEWLERQAPPSIVAPKGAAASAYRMSVPNNAMDLVARAWVQGNYTGAGDANPATHRALKTVQPMWMLYGDVVFYFWPLDDPFNEEVRGFVAELMSIVSRVVALGWGIDLAVGQGSIIPKEQADAIPGERWLPIREAKNDGLRTPTHGTLNDLLWRHEHFLKRVNPDDHSYNAPPPLSVFRTIEYRRSTDPPRRLSIAFSLLKPGSTGYRAFDTPRQALTVAGMFRCATKRSAKNTGWSDEEVGRFVLGHGESKGSSKHEAVGPHRFAYIPLPSIEARGANMAQVVGPVRRVMLTSSSDEAEEQMAWARRVLPGQSLVEDGKTGAEPVAVLGRITGQDNVIRRYTDRAPSWATVTPVVLPGYDDPAHYRRRLGQGTTADEQKKLLSKLCDRIDGLIRKAIVHAGFSQELADHAEIEWRKTGYWPGVDLADRYGVPDHLKRFSRYHVQIRWLDRQGNAVEIPGPICISGGRYYGVGLFAALPRDNEPAPELKNDHP
jgi:CRISPR-associated protein Csb2